jgi:hypothetical protein
MEEGGILVGELLLTYFKYLFWNLKFPVYIFVYLATVNFLDLTMKIEEINIGGIIVLGGAIMLLIILSTEFIHFGLKNIIRIIKKKRK